MEKMITKMGKRFGLGLLVGLALFGYNAEIYSRTVTFTGAATNFISKENITVTKAGSTSSQTITCISSSSITYTSFNGAGSYLQFTLANPSTEKIDSIRYIWRFGSSDAKFVMLYGSTLTLATDVWTGSNGGWKESPTIGTTSAGNCPGAVLKFPTGTSASTVVLCRRWGVNPTSYPENSNQSSFVGRMNNSTTTTYPSVYGSSNTSYPGEVTLYISDIITCTSPDPKTVSGTTSICSGSSTNITLASAQNGVGYDLYKNGTKVNGTSQTGDGNDLTWSVSEAGTYTVKTNSTGGYCDGVTMNGSAEITVNALPTPTFTSAPATSARFINVTYSTQSDQSNYIWNISGVSDTDYSIVSGGTSSDNSVTLQWLTAGTKTVSVNYQNSNGCSATNATQTTTEVSENLASPTLTAAVNASVDAPLDITFTDDATWRAAITDVQVNDESLSTSAYSLSAGILTLTPVNDTKLQTPGSKSVKVIATGYIDATISQPIAAGAVTQWSISTQPVAPATNHGVFATQPIITFKDQYNNITGSASVTATASSGWTLGGTATVNASEGIATFSGLTAGTADYSALSDATIVFSTSGLSDLTSSAFDIPAYSSASTDYYRTKTTGNWNDAATWESSPDNSNWFDATAYPDANANTTTLLHNVTYIGTPATVGNVTVNSGVTLTNTSSAIAVAAGKTLTVTSGGTFENQASTGSSISAGSGSIQVNGTYKTTALNAANSALAFTNISFASNATLNISGTSNIRIPASCAYNVEWSSSASNSFVNSASNTITGNLTISNTAAVLNNGTGGSARSVTISGNLIITNGQYNPQGGTGATQALTVNGNVILSGTGKLYAVNPSATGVGNVTLKGNLQIENPTNVAIGNGGGSSANLYFAGTTQQTVSTNLQTGYTIAGFTLNNNTGLALGSDLIITGNPILTSGNIIPGNYKLTLLGSVSGSGSIDNSGTPVVEYSGTNPQTITNIEGSTINQLLINNPAGVTLSTDLTANTVTVNPGSKLTIADGKTLTVSDNTLKLLSSETGGTATLLGNVSGNALVEQNLSAVRNWYMSSPVAAGEMPAAGHWYNETLASGNWQAVSSGASMTVGRGYIVVPSATGNVSFSGALNNGDQSIALTRTDANTGYKGFNLVGNPYPSFLNAATLLSVNRPTGSEKVENNIWYRTIAGTNYQFQTYNASGNVEVPQASNGAYIPPMQAFWVRALQNNVDLNFTNAMRKHNDTESAILLRAPKAPASDRQLIRLQVSNGSLADELVIYSDANALNSYDKYDSPKMMNSSSSQAAINMFTSVGSENLVIDGRNTLPLDVVIPVSFTTNAFASGSYTLAANELTNIPSGVTVTIVDNSVETPLSDGGTYTFTADAGTNKTFGLILRSPGTVTGLENGNAANITVYANGNRQLVVNAQSATLVNVFNATGQRIASQNMNSTSLKIDVPAAGVYMVSVGSNVRKVVAP